uniref:Uncharacterized protein n=1 Tax=Ananas comosus var. bracteatus TaxID=296719 RepID=A0A6V7QS58_ANACO
MLVAGESHCRINIAPNFSSPFVPRPSQKPKRLRLRRRRCGVRCGALPLSLLRSTPHGSSPEIPPWLRGEPSAGAGDLQEPPRRRRGATASAAADRVQASDALPLPIRHTNLLFSAIFAASLVYLMRRWREKIRSSTPLHVVGLAEIFAIFGLVASLIYLLSFFGIAFVQSIVSSNDEEDDFLLAPPSAPPQTPAAPAPCSLLVSSESAAAAAEKMPEEDEEIAASVVAGKTPSYLLETKLGDCRRAAGIRREALRRITGRGMEGLPLDGFDYGSILGQCCELPWGTCSSPWGSRGRWCSTGGSTISRWRRRRVASWRAPTGAARPSPSREAPTASSCATG